MKVPFGSGLKDCEKIQRYHRTDPHKNVPFFDDSNYVSKKELLVCAALIVGMYGYYLIYTCL